ncbi:mucin-5AC-like [Sycon ciliatum]|uniref:mucin-5AC-like n=1 Tax=Sycon ciliatum TaxID=27933 RepID=UPI0031F665A0
MIAKTGARDAGRGRGRRGGGSYRKGSKARISQQAPQRAEELDSNAYRYYEPEPSRDDQFDEEIMQRKYQRQQDDAKQFSGLLHQPLNTALHQHRQDAILPEADIGIDLNALAKNLLSIPVHTRLNISADHLSSATIAEFQRSANASAERVKSSYNSTSQQRLVNATDISPAPIHQYIARARIQDLPTVADNVTTALSTSSSGEQKSVPAQSDPGPCNSAPAASPIQQVQPTPQQCGPYAQVSDGKDGDGDAVLDAILLLALPTASATPAAVTSTSTTTAPARRRDPTPAPRVTHGLQTAAGAIGHNGDASAHCAPTTSLTSVLVTTTTSRSPATASNSSRQNIVSWSRMSAKPTVSASMGQRVTNKGAPNKGALVANKGAPVAAIGAGLMNMDTVATSKRSAAVAAVANADDYDDDLDFLLAL